MLPCLMFLIHFQEERKINRIIRILFLRVWSARYNRFHDQLVVTSSSDTRVMLFNIASLSSEPYGSLNTSDDTK
jgi:hypothetical protein